MLLENKIAVITGAASERGIGWATAKRFVEEGARVAIIDLDNDQTKSAARRLGEGHYGYTCDVRNSEECQRVIQKIIDRFGGIDILVLIRASTRSSDFFEESEKAS
jgi:NAD(P)-dependent dehydrogenase (short-subunit alcohol dehydrogenase family)